jgi:hypothetical protein
MQETCHRCGAELPADSGESPFCPHCGTPQLFLSLENQSVETGGDPAIGADGTPSTGALPPPLPRQVEWKTAIRCAALVAAIAAVLSLAAIRVDALSMLSFLWIMSASLITLGFYQKRRPAAWMDVKVGAHIGVVVGICLAVELGVAAVGAGLMGRFVLHSMGNFDAQMSWIIAEGQRRSQEWASAPMPPALLALERTPEFHAGYALFYFAFGSAVLLVVSTLGGAFAGLLRMRRRTLV